MEEEESKDTARHGYFNVQRYIFNTYIYVYVYLYIYIYKNIYTGWKNNSVKNENSNGHICILQP